MAHDNFAQVFASLEELLLELEALQERKRQALASLDSLELTQVAQAEELLVERLAALTRRQAELGAAVTPTGGAAPTMRNLAQRLPEPHRGHMLTALDRIRARAQAVRQQAVANWMSAYRSNQTMHELLELIARAGSPAAAETPGGGEGLILDRAT